MLVKNYMLSKDLRLFAAFGIVFIMIFYKLFIKSLFPAYYFSDIEERILISATQLPPFHFHFFDSTLNTARIYAYFPSFFAARLFTFLVFCWFCFYTNIKTTKLTDFLIFSFFLLSSVVYLSEPDKEFMFIPIAILIFTLLKNHSSSIRIITTFALTFFLYGLFFRVYFILADMIFLGICTLTFLHKKISISTKSLIISLILGLTITIILLNALVPEQTWRYLDVSIRPLNRVGGFGANTAFANLLHETNIFAFIGNYIYSIIHLLLPIFFIFNLKTLYLQTFLIIYIGVIVNFIKNKDPNLALIKYAGIFTLSLLFVQFIFEPDYGSILRHCTEMIPLLVLAKLYTHKNNTIDQIHPLRSQI